MATNISTLGKTGADYSSIATWESDTTLDLVTAGDIEILEVYNDLGAVTVSSTLTFAGATVDATHYRVIKAADGEGWEGDTTATSSATLALQGNYRLVCEEEYFRFDGLRFTGNGASNFCFGADADNVMVVRCLFDGRAQTFNIAELTGTRAGWQFLRCVMIDGGEYTVDTSSSGTNYCQNCTFYGCNYGPSTYGGGRLVYNNSISVGNSNNHYADSPSNWATGTDYNIMGGSDYYPSGNVIQNAVATASTSPGAGTWVMYNSITADSEDFNIQDHASNQAKDYGKTLTGEVVTDAAGVAASGTWECGALNFYVAPGGETYEVTIASSLALNHTELPFRHRSRRASTALALNHTELPFRHRSRRALTALELNDVVTTEVVFYVLVNAVLISSDLTLNDAVSVQRLRDRVGASPLALSSHVAKYLQASRHLMSSIPLTSNLIRELSLPGAAIQRFLSSNLTFDDVLAVQRHCDRGLLDALDLPDVTRVAREVAKQLLSSFEVDDAGSASAERLRWLHSDIDIDDALAYEIAAFLQYAIVLHSALTLSDGVDIEVEKQVFRLVETFIPLYTRLISERKQLIEARLQDRIELYDALSYSVRSFLTEVLLHDSLSLDDNVITALQRLLKPIGVVIYGLEKARVQYSLAQSGSNIEYTLQRRGPIIYTLHNPKGKTVYH